MSIVVLPERNTRYNLREAEVYGRIVYVSDAALDPFNVQETQALIQRRLKEMGFNPHHDYICMTGHTISVALFCCAVVEVYPKFQLLMFDARSSSYRLQHYRRNGAHDRTKRIDT